MVPKGQSDGGYETGAQLLIFWLGKVNVLHRSVSCGVELKPAGNCFLFFVLDGGPRKRDATYCNRAAVFGGG